MKLAKAMAVEIFLAMGLSLVVLSASAQSDITSITCDSLAGNDSSG
jgi:hypothetical protein